MYGVRILGNIHNVEDYYFQEGVGLPSSMEYAAISFGYILVS